MLSTCPEILKPIILCSDSMSEWLDLLAYIFLERSNRGTLEVFYETKWDDELGGAWWRPSGLSRHTTAILVGIIHSFIRYVY